MLFRSLYLGKGSVEVLPNGIEIEAVRNRAEASLELEGIEEGKPLIAAIGRLVPQKGFNYLLDAYALVLREMDSQLVVLGEGPLRSELEAQAELLGIADSVLLPGFISEPFPLLKRAELFVLSSVYEGFGIVVLEAMVCGTPVAATDCHWGPAELLRDGEAGLLVPPADVGELAGAILESLRNPEAARERAAFASLEAESYSILAVADRFEKLIEDTM